jgi:hypothetical protein
MKDRGCVGNTSAVQCSAVQCSAVLKPAKSSQLFWEEATEPGVYSGGRSGDLYRLAMEGGGGGGGEEGKGG